MLNAMREGAKSGLSKFVLVGLMAMATFGLVLTDVGGFFGGGFGRQTIAKVGDIELTLPVFNSIYQRELNRTKIPPEVARTYGVPQMTLGREINRIALLQAAHKSKIRVGDAFVAKNITKQLEDAGLKGDAQENLTYALRQMNMSEEQLARLTREDITTALVNVAAANTAKALPAAVEALYRYGQEKRVAEIITITPSDVKNENVSDDDAMAFYESNTPQFTSPEKRSITMLHMTTDAIGRDIIIEDSMIAEFYEDNKSEYRQPDQYRFTQKVFDTADEAQSAIDSNVELDAEADWFNTENLPQSLNDALKNAKAGDVVGPIETSLGHHVVNVIDIKKDAYTPLPEVKKEIAALLRDKEIEGQLYTLADDLDNAVADGLSLTEISKQYNVPLKNVANLEMAITANPTLSANENDALEIIETVFIIEQEEISPVIEMSDGSFALVEVNQITEQKVEDFNSVKTDIKKVLNTQRTQVAVQNKATTLMAAFNKGEGSMADLARKNNVSFNQTRAVLREPQGGVAVSTNEANLLFSLTPTNDISSLRVGNDVKIIRLSDIQSVASIPTEGTEIAALKEKLTADMNNEIQQQFSNAWKEDLGVDINTALFQQAFLTAQDDQ